MSYWLKKSSNYSLNLGKGLVFNVRGGFRIATFPAFIEGSKPDSVHGRLSAYYLVLYQAQTPYSECRSAKRDANETGSLLNN